MNLKLHILSESIVQGNKTKIAYSCCLGVYNVIEEFLHQLLDGPSQHFFKRCISFWLCWVSAAVCGLRLVAVCRLLIVLASCVAECGL